MVSVGSRGNFAPFPFVMVRDNDPSLVDLCRMFYRYDARFNAFPLLPFAMPQAFSLLELPTDLLPEARVADGEEEAEVRHAFRSMCITDGSDDGYRIGRWKRETAEGDNAPTNFVVYAQATGYSPGGLLPEGRCNLPRGRGPPLFFAILILSCYRM
jgi:hypothetical protein